MSDGPKNGNHRCRGSSRRVIHERAVLVIRRLTRWDEGGHRAGYPVITVPTNDPHISTDYNIDDRWIDVSRWCRDIHPIWIVPPGETWNLDLSGCRYLGPFAAAILYATWRQAMQLGKHPAVRLPTEPEPLAAFCKFSNLNHLLLGEQQADPTHMENETIPLYQFFDHAYEQTNRVLNFVKRHQRLTNDDEITLTSAIHEVCQNIEDHAKSPIGGVSCARYFKQSREVRVAVVDTGITIAASLGKSRVIGSDEEAMELVTRGGITSGFHRHNKGLGISNLISFVKAMNGTLAIISGSAVARVAHRSGEVKTERLDWRFPGTGVFFTLTVSQADDDPNEYG